MTSWRRRRGGPRRPPGDGGPAQVDRESRQPMQVQHNPLFGLRRWRNADFATLTLWAVTALAVEVLGRLSGSDLGDAFSLVVGLALLIATVQQHRRQPLAWLAPIGRAAHALRRRLSTPSLELGIDFRRTPPIAEAIPAPLRVGALITGILTVLVAPQAASFPEAARAFAVEISYCGYLLLLALLWAGLLIGGLALGCLPSFAVVHDRLVGSWSGLGQRNIARELLILSALLLMLALGSRVLPEWLPLVVIALAGAVIAALLLVPGAPSVRVLWRRPDGPLASMAFGHAVGLWLLIVILYVVDLTLLARGNRVFGGEPAVPTMTITATLGLAFSWMTAAGISSIAWYALRYGRRRIRFELARRTPVQVLVSGDIEPAQLPRRLAPDVVLHRHRPRGHALRLIVDDRAAWPLLPFDRIRWPLRVPTAAFHDPALAGILRRRQQRIYRAQLLAGMARIFDQARHHRGRPGEGCWLAPQHWFVTSLVRDENHDDIDLRHHAMIEESLGLPFERALTWPTRVWFHGVMRELDIDLMFVEDGINYARFRPVLESLFELHDIFGGRQRAEEKHMIGIPGVRVVIHDFQLDTEVNDRGYPEPDYEDIGRARILHVFLDRGDAVDPWQVPGEWLDLPAPHIPHAH